MKVGVCCHDAGGAEIVSSYILHNKLNAIYLLKGPAVKIFEKKLGKINNISLDRLSMQADWFICGTSWQSDLEWELVKKAKKLNKKVVSFLDHWVNYKERYVRNGETVLPDEIWVGDKYAKKIAKDYFQNIKIQLISNPYFLDIKKQLFELKNTKKQKGEIDTVLYVCEPIREHAYLQHGDEYYWGYTEEEALRYFLSNINRVCGSNPAIVIRPHPSEDLNKYSFVIEEFNQLNIKISNNRTLLEQILESDVVVGCESMAMVVALLANKKVISSIPKGGRACVLPHKEIESVRNYV
ncbi:MAG: hypothetical protein ISR65_20170 [Bacteriovoracaceae bacterium]|nr:hypothetical protein [Bacteroidota bacterium]MBL6992111.1 hypothetical protein [Bacteriovoracaceae bacterium]